MSDPKPEPSRVRLHGNRLFSLSHPIGLLCYYWICKGSEMLWPMLLFPIWEVKAARYAISGQPWLFYDDFWVMRSAFAVQWDLV